MIFLNDDFDHECFRLHLSMLPNLTMTLFKDGGVYGLSYRAEWH